jgi:signal transduction histidine kinase
MIARGFSFQVGLVALVILQILVGVAIITWLSLRSERRAVRELALQLQGEAAVRTREHLASFLDTPARINAINTEAVAGRMLDTESWEELERYFWRQGLLFEGVGTIGFGGAQGGFVGANAAEGYLVTTETPSAAIIRRYSSDTQGDRVELLLERPGYDVRERPWYQTARKTGRPTWTEVTVSVNQPRLDATAVCPVYDDRGDHLGVFMVDVALSQISDFLKTLDIGGSGYAFIVDDEGQIVATSAGERPFRHESDGEQLERISATASTLPVIRQTAQELAADPVRLQHDAEGVQFRVKTEDGFHFAHCSAVVGAKGVGGLDWHLVVVVPEREFLDRLGLTKGATVFLLVGLAILVAAVGGLTARWFVQPLMRINAAAKAIAQGELGQELAVRRKNELGELAESLGTITEQLQISFSELRQANRESQHHKNQLRSMASEMSLAEEKERRRIASDVHSRVIQAMVLAKIKAGSVLESLTKEPNLRELESIRQLIQDAIDEARSLLLELSPPVLFELGLGPAIEWLADRLEEEHGISCTFHDDGLVGPLNLDLQIVIFQATRELLNNVAKYSDAEQTTITCRPEDEFLVVTVEDNGVGFDPSAIRAGQPDREGGFGLFNIRERLDLVGGRLEIDSVPGRGTRISLVAPLTAPGDRVVA